MRDIYDAAYAVDKLQATYSAKRAEGLDRNQAIIAAADENGIPPTDRFKVAGLVRDEPVVV